MLETKMQNNKVLPQTGDTILVRNRSEVRGNGKADIVYSKDKEVRTIAGIYIGSNLIRDHVGESWAVVPSDDAKAKWMTVA